MNDLRPDSRPFWKRSLRPDLLPFSPKALRLAVKRGALIKSSSARMAIRFAKRLNFTSAEEET